MARLPSLSQTRGGGPRDDKTNALLHAPGQAALRAVGAFARRRSATVQAVQTIRGSCHVQQRHDDRHCHPRRPGRGRRAAPGAGPRPGARAGRSADPRQRRRRQPARPAAARGPLPAAAGRAGDAGAGGRRRHRGRGRAAGKSATASARCWAAAAMPSTPSADARHVLPIPAGIEFVQAAALPETVFTVYANVFEHGALQGRRDACWCTAPRRASASPRSRWPRPPAPR